MYVVCVNSKVKPEYAERYLAECMEYAANTRKEPGNVRFDVLRAEDDPCRLFFYEVYRSKEDFLAHQQTAHYFKWRDTVKEWMAEPRQGVKYDSIFPGDDAKW